jgi:uncharacterized NAD(P)/FAD-binding protein YdhS
MHPEDPVHTRSAGRTIAVIGGGAAGTLVAIHLLHAGAGRLRPLVIEPRALLGEGVAYSTRDPAHLLNVRAGNMSAFGAEPGDFVRHVEASAPDADPSADAPEPIAQRYLPRRHFSAYLRQTLARLAAPDDMHVRDEVVDVEGDGPYVLHLRSGARLAADAIVLATGNAPRPPLAASPRVVQAWDHAAIAAIGAGEDIAIVGSGLSMVDVVVTLAGRGHRGRIDVVSRHGLLPLPHAAIGGASGDVADLLGLGLRERVRALRADAARLQREGAPWQLAMDRLRPHGVALWQSLDAAAQRRFLRHVVRHWDIHRHRIAPEVGARVDASLASGQLRVHAGRVRSLDAGVDGVTLSLRRRGSEVDTTLAVARVVDCTGIETRLAAMPGALFPALARRGRIRAGAHGLGLDVTGEGAVLDAGGTPSPSLFTIGTPRLGSEWETTAIPELRTQAAAIARRLLDAAG